MIQKPIKLIRFRFAARHLALATSGFQQNWQNTYQDQSNVTGEPESGIDLERGSELENDKWKYNVGKHQFGDEEGDQIVGQSRCFVRLEVRTNVLSSDSRSAREDSSGQEGHIIARIETCERRSERINDRN